MSIRSWHCHLEPPRLLGSKDPVELRLVNAAESLGGPCHEQSQRAWDDGACRADWFYGISDVRDEIQHLHSFWRAGQRQRYTGQNARHDSALLSLRLWRRIPF